MNHSSCIRDLAVKLWNYHSVLNCNFVTSSSFETSYNLSYFQNVAMDYAKDAELTSLSLMI